MTKVLAQRLQDLVEFQLLFRMTSVLPDLLEDTIETYLLRTNAAEVHFLAALVRSDGLIHVKVFSPPTITSDGAFVPSFNKDYRGRFPVCEWFRGTTVSAPGILAAEFLVGANADPPVVDVSDVNGTLGEGVVGPQTELYIEIENIGFDPVHLSLDLEWYEDIPNEG